MDIFGRRKNSFFFFNEKKTHFVTRLRETCQWVLKRVDRKWWKGYSLPTGLLMISGGHHDDACQRKSSFIIFPFSLALNSLILVKERKRGKWKMKFLENSYIVVFNLKNSIEIKFLLLLWILGWKGKKKITKKKTLLLL